MRDAIGLTGLVLLCGGVYCISPPLSLVVGGAILLMLAVGGFLFEVRRNVSRKGVRTRT